MSRLTIGFLVAVAPALSICLALLGLETMRSNAMGWFLFVFGIAYPAGGAIYYFITRKPFWSATTPGGTSVEERGDPSFWAILPGFLVIFFAAPLEWTYLSGRMPRLPWMQGAGLGLILASLLVHAWARIQMGGQYSGHLEVAGGQRLVQSGPYRCVRHPGYSRSPADGTRISHRLLQPDRTDLHPAAAAARDGIQDAGGRAPADQAVRV